MPSVFRSLLSLPLAVLCVHAAGAELFVSQQGDDRSPGTRQRPVRTWDAARRLVRAQRPAGPVTVWFRGGTYYLPATVIFESADSGSASAPVTYAAWPGERVVISGGVALRLQWKPYRDRILVARVPAGFSTDQLFVNGQRQPMARYPNYDPAIAHFGGWSADAFSKERAARWARPAGGYIHAMHRALWGDFHYIITGKDASGNVTYEGGWQNNRRMGMHDKYRFVENIFEELDAPGEWFLDQEQSRLYFYPPSGVDMKTATVEAVRLRHLVEFRGSESAPVRHVRIRGLAFRHAARTFMENREPLLRSDWTTYRGGAILLEGTEDCALEEITVDQVGGNAVFAGNYNRRLAIRRAHIVAAGANGVAFVGDPQAVRNPLFEYAQRQALKDLDLTPGPKTNNYPADCLIEDSLIHETGRVEKQTAPVQISMARRITVRHCSLYDVPRAGINISEGTWGGHLIEYCDVFDTVKETGDHGSFNSWGRDRYWGLTGVSDREMGAGTHSALPLLDAVEPTVIRNSRWRCDHGWDIDLDDGSSNYRIYNNLTLAGGIKLREGFHRSVENNIIANNSFHPHVWYPNSQDVFRRNIVFAAYRPIRVPQPWGKECDANLLHSPGQSDARPAESLRKQSERDGHSISADAMFEDAAAGDYRLRAGSPAFALGFEPFPLDRFGVQWAPLKALARTPVLAGPADGGSATTSTTRDVRAALWLGATVRNLAGLGEVSAAGTSGETGVLVLQVPPQSPAAAAGIRPGDVILELDGKPTPALADLPRLSAAAPQFGSVGISVWRAQRSVQLHAEAPLR
jgi:hypothetical protein